MSSSFFAMNASICAVSAIQIFRNRPLLIEGGGTRSGVPPNMAGSEP